MTENKKIHIQKNGPYRVDADVVLEKELVVPDDKNDPLTWKKGEKYETKGGYSLCRCGASKSKPFCDGAHAKIEWDGTETADKQCYKDKMEILEGPELDLKDISPLCARARFCHRLSGTWRLTQMSDDPRARDTAIQQACDCPSGRLVAMNKDTREEIERDCEASIGVTEDIPAGVSGPLWVKGGVEVVGEDGESYEVRQRQTLCRCGKSKNKPFCDGTHINVGFDDKE